MAAKIDLSAEIRTETGRRASRRLRRLANKVLGTVYGAHKEPASIVMDHHKVSKALENEAFFSSILTMHINNQPEKVVIKAIQRHPSKPKILHMDFFRINPKEKLTMHIPLHFIGEELTPGIKAGGVISHFISEVEVKCLPADLPEYIEVDLSKLELDDYVHLADLKLPAGVELVAFSHGDIEEHNAPVANVHIPRIVEEPVEAAPISPEVEATKVTSAAAEEKGVEEAK